MEPGVIENESAQRAAARVEPGVREIAVTDFCEGEKHHQQRVECCSREREKYMVEEVDAILFFFFFFFFFFLLALFYFLPYAPCLSYFIHLQSPDHS